MHADPDHPDTVLADAMRAEAHEQFKVYEAMMREVRAFEKENNLFPPCHLCGRRVGCSH